MFVCPQATGKSIALQLLELFVDRGHVHDMFERYNVDTGQDAKVFFDGYFGEGMASLWKPGSKLVVDEESVDLTEFARKPKGASRSESLFFVPAQRVMSLRDGTTRNFGQFRFGDPYVLRALSDTVHNLLQNEYGAKGAIFHSPTVSTRHCASRSTTSSSAARRCRSITRTTPSARC